MSGFYNCQSEMTNLLNELKTGNITPKPDGVQIGGPWLPLSIKTPSIVKRVKLVNQPRKDYCFMGFINSVHSSESSEPSEPSESSESSPSGV
jgi:hypothetical protein